MSALPSALGTMVSIGACARCGKTGMLRAVYVENGASTEMWCADCAHVTDRPDDKNGALQCARCGRLCGVKEGAGDHMSNGTWMCRACIENPTEETFPAPQVFPVEEPMEGLEALFGDVNEENDTRVACERCGAMVTDTTTVYVDGNTQEEWCEGCASNHTAICNGCEEVCSTDDLVVIDDEIYCSHCRDNPQDCGLQECARCGQVHHEDNFVDVLDGNGNTQSWCDRCAHGYTYTCEDCGELTDINLGDDNRCVCYNCSHNYYACESCGCLVDPDDVYRDHDDNIYCEDCWNEHRPAAIPDSLLANDNDHNCLVDYSRVILPGSGPNTLGFELEMDDGDRAAFIRGFTTVFGHRGYLDNDCSLSNMGIEVCSAIGDLASWRRCKEEYIDELCSIAQSHGYKSENARHCYRECGLHIHMARAAYGETEDEQLKNISKVIYLVDKFYGYIRQLSRRGPGVMEYYATAFRYVQDGLTEEEINEFGQRGEHSGNKFAAINLEHPDTIEFRFFRGTLNPSKIMAAFEFIDVLYKIAMHNPTGNIEGITWDFIKAVANGDSYQYIGPYMAERGV